MCNTTFHLQGLSTSHIKIQIDSTSDKPVLTNTTVIDQLTCTRQKWLKVHKVALEESPIYRMLMVYATMRTQLLTLEHKLFS